jgi:hypothetical protein
MIVVLRLAFVLAWLTPLAVARIGDVAVYPLKERRAQDTAELTLEEFINLDLTFSDDSPPKELLPFYLDLIETDGNLPVNPSLSVVEIALEDFIAAELGAIFGKNDAIESVNATIVSQEAITRSGSSNLPLLGSRLETQVSVMFDNEPSPDATEVDTVLMEIMQNLTYFLDNLTAWADQDSELNRVHTATRSEIDQTAPTGTVGSGTTGLEQNTNQEVDDNEGVDISVLIPVITGGVVLFALIALLATRRKEQTTTVPISPKKSQPLDVEVYMDDNDDNFSYETSLAESPVKGFSSILKPQTYGLQDQNHFTSELDRLDEELSQESRETGDAMDAMDAGDNESDMFSDIFSGVDSHISPSPRNGDCRSIFSFLSAITRGSGSTLAVSNTTQGKKYTPSEIADAAVAAGAPVLGVTRSSSTTPGSHTTTPKSRKSSLFNFEEGDEEDKSLNSGITELYGIDEAPSDEERSGKDSTQEPDEQQPILVLLSSDSSDFGPQPNAPRSPGTPNSVDFSNILSDKSAYDMMGDSGFASISTQSPSVLRPTALVEPAVSVEDIRADLSKGITDNKSPNKSAYSANSTSATPMIQNTKSSKTRFSNPGPYTPGDASTYSNEVVHLKWSDPKQSSKNAVLAAEFVDSFAPLSAASSEDPENKGRRHAKSTTGDGTSAYQSEAMHPMDWSLTSYDGGSVSGSEISRTELADELAGDHIQGGTGIVTIKEGKRTKIRWSKAPATPTTPKSPKSPGTTPRSLADCSVQSDGSSLSASRQLITDLVWLEKKIANSGVPKSQEETPRSAPALVQTDSLSFVSNGASNQDSYDSTINLGTPTSQGRRSNGGMQAIVCRDCFAPPGKLKIVIHSTKDGPAVHTVKKGSSLEGHIFPGDLIISVDNVDTRSYTAEQVMKMMTTKTRFERKITVLHFEDESTGMV